MDGRASEAGGEVRLWTFAADPALEEEIRALAALEALCRGSLRSEVTRETDQVTWLIAGGSRASRSR